MENHCALQNILTPAAHSVTLFGYWVGAGVISEHEIILDEVDPESNLTGVLTVREGADTWAHRR